MSSFPFDPKKLLLSATSATGVHIDPARVLDGLTRTQAGDLQKDFPHSIFQICNHIIYWQDLFLSGLSETQMQGPKHAEDGWPGAQVADSDEEWESIVARYKMGIERARQELDSQDPLSSIPAVESTLRIEILNSLALHVSYHVGQIVLIRRSIGAWPPPGGGHTW